MNSPATPTLWIDSRVWLLWLSIATQQVAFTLAYSLRVPLVAISEWVIFVPVVIIWVLHIVVPLLTPMRERKHALLRAYALTGWIFVFAAVAWDACYISLSEKYGTPVSYDQMQKIQKWANQPPEPTPATVTPPAGQEARQP